MEQRATVIEPPTEAFGSGGGSHSTISRPASFKLKTTFNSRRYTMRVQGEGTLRRGCFSSFSQPGIHRGNDFLRLQEDVEAPNRRGGLDAPSFLRHFPQADVEKLGELWGSSSLNKEHFVRLVLHFIAHSPFFDEQGGKRIDLWEKEGWLTSHTARLGRLHGERRIQDLPEDIEQNDIVRYLNDIFLIVDTHRTGGISWELFTLYLIEGITGRHIEIKKKKKRGGPSGEKSPKQSPRRGRTSPDLVDEEEDEEGEKEDEEEDHSGAPRSQPVAYAFRGEVTFLHPKGKQTRCKEWYGRLEYVEPLDRVLAISKDKVVYVGASTLGGSSQALAEDPPIVLSHHNPVTAATYLPHYECTIANIIDPHPVWCWQHSPTGDPRDPTILQFPHPDQSPASSMIFHQNELWVGTRQGSVFSLPVLREEARGIKYSFGKTTARGKHPSASVTCMYPVEHNMNLITGADDGTLLLFEAGGRQKERVHAHEHAVTSVNFQQQYNVLVTAGYDSALHVWGDNLWTRPVFTLYDNIRPLASHVIGLASIPATPYIVAGDASGMLKMFDLRTKGVVFTLAVTDQANFDLGLVRREHLRAETAASGGERQSDQKNHLFGGMAFTGSDHRQFLFGGARVYEFAMASDVQENPMLTYNQDNAVTGAYAHERFGVFTVSGDEATMWSMKTGMPDQREQRLTDSGIAVSLLEPDSDLLYLGHNDGRLSVHQASTGIQLQQLLNHKFPVVALANHPTEPMLASACKDHKLCIWEDSDLFGPDAHAQVQNAVLKKSPQQVIQYSSPVSGVAFHPQGVLMLGQEAAIWFYVYNRAFKRWLINVKILTGKGSELQCVRLLPPQHDRAFEAYVKRKPLSLASPTQQEGSDDDGTGTVSGGSEDGFGQAAVVVTVCAVDNRGRVSLWNVSCDSETSENSSFALVWFWVNSALQHKHRMGPPTGTHPAGLSDGVINPKDLVANTDRFAKIALEAKERHDELQLLLQEKSEEQESKDKQLLHMGKGATKKTSANNTALRSENRDIEPILLEAFAATRVEGAMAPPLRVVAFDSVYPFLLYTGDDLGRISVWFFEDSYRHWRRKGPSSPFGKAQRKKSMGSPFKVLGKKNHDHLSLDFASIPHFPSVVVGGLANESICSVESTGTDEETNPASPHASFSRRSKEGVSSNERSRRRSTVTSLKQRPSVVITSKHEPGAPQRLFSFAAHTQPVSMITTNDTPFHCIVSCGAENQVVLSSWEGVKLGVLQQGPLADRVWSLSSVLAENGTRKLMPRLMWHRLRLFVLAGGFWEMWEEQERERERELQEREARLREMSQESRVTFSAIPSLGEAQGSGVHGGELPVFSSPATSLSGSLAGASGTMVSPARRKSLAAARQRTSPSTTSEDLFFSVGSMGARPEEIPQRRAPMSKYRVPMRHHHLVPLTGEDLPLAVKDILEGGGRRAASVPPPPKHRHVDERELKTMNLKKKAVLEANGMDDQGARPPEEEEEDEITALLHRVSQLPPLHLQRPRVGQPGGGESPGRAQARKKDMKVVGVAPEHHPGVVSKVIPLRQETKHQLEKSAEKTSALQKKKDIVPVGIARWRSHLKRPDHLPSSLSGAGPRDEEQEEPSSAEEFSSDGSSDTDAKGPDSFFHYDGDDRTRTLNFGSQYSKVRRGGKSDKLRVSEVPIHHRERPSPGKYAGGKDRKKRH